MGPHVQNPTRRFGARSSQTLVHDTVLQAPRDGFVEAYIESTNGVYAFTDGSAPPTQKIQGTGSHTTGTSVIFLVLKNDYWKINCVVDLIGHFFTPFIP